MSETRDGDGSSSIPPSRLIASLLSGAWRQMPPAPKLTTAELERIAPLLIKSGGGALAFWKLRGTPLESTTAAQDLKQTYRLYTLQAAIHEREIAQVIKLLKPAGIAPVLVKGWSVARKFPEPALRPYGDIDLFIHPEQFDKATEILSSPEGRKFFVDLHKGADHLDTTPFDVLYERAQVVGLGDETVRVLADEDHLRVLCVHFLHHGGWRPAGLCDIGLLVESSGASFDWEACLTGDKKRAGWVACTVALAHQLLGADISETPITATAANLPRWLVPAVLREWNNPVSIDHVVPPPLAKRLSHPFETIKAIRRRWPPNPIQATIVMNGAFNNWPRIIYQAGNYVARTAKFLAKLPGTAGSSQKT
ncbi:MAG: nucleotidyltransferase family protein [Pyrinomonadaceae bacterium]|nr:nucleotidyltransferase family protein [Pyrinomonadaceae bacterium]